MRYQGYGFDAVLEKNFNRVELKRILELVFTECEVGCLLMVFLTINV
ncbi:hypothetical protein MNBD_GAMMA17-786 [hydrothermal vent metagenome]|uniref:Uncharacterized protein n=1 Tax=hydrothermal vent metagenome TaxID=652676 RepID=A0A3B0ZRQ0_9ZZZZ